MRVQLANLRALFHLLRAVSLALVVRKYFDSDVRGFLRLMVWH